MKGSVKKDANGWYYVVDVGTNGKRKQQKRRFKTKKEAEKALTEVIHSLNQGTFIQPSHLLYKDYLDQWFSTKMNSISVQTAEVYKQHLQKRIVPALGNYILSKITVVQLQSFINNLIEEGLSSATVKKVHAIVRNSLEHAVDFELIAKNPALKVKLPKDKKEEMKIWNEEEVRAFLKVAEEDLMHIVFRLALSTGMRQGEILGLRFKDIDFDKGLIHVRQTLSHDGKNIIPGAKTQSSLRSINVDQRTLKLLKSRKTDVSKEKLKLGSLYKDFELVACTQHGTPLNPANVRRTFNRLIKLADVQQIRFHDLRHTHATLLGAKGVPIKVISERLGHKNTRVTLDTYSHVLPTMQEDVVRKLDEMAF